MGAPHRHSFNDLAFHRIDPDDLFLGEVGIINIFTEAIQVVGAEDDVDVRVFFQYPGDYDFFLRHASAQDDQQIGIFRFQMLYPSQLPEYPVLGVFPDRAGVEDYDIGRALFFRGPEIHRFQQAGHFLRIGQIALAAVSFDEVFSVLPDATQMIRQLIPYMLRFLLDPPPRLRKRGKDIFLVFVLDHQIHLFIIILNFITPDNSNAYVKTIINASFLWYNTIMINELDYYYKKHPESKIQDFIKYVYQKHFGPGHFIVEANHAYNLLMREADALEPVAFREDIYDYVGDVYARVNLRPYVSYGFDLRELSAWFVSSGGAPENREDFTADLEELRAYLIGKRFSKDEFDALTARFRVLDWRPFSHTPHYRNAYHPAYRLINRKFITDELRFAQFRNFLRSFPPDELSLIAIRGGDEGMLTKCCERAAKELPVTVIDQNRFNAGVEFDRQSHQIVLVKGAAPGKCAAAIYFDDGKNPDHRKYDCDLIV